MQFITVGMVRHPRTEELLREMHESGNRHGLARVEVRRHEDIIRRAVDEGYAVKEVWRTLKTKNLITCQYDAFRVQTRKLLRQGVARSRSTSRKGQIGSVRAVIEGKGGN